MFEKAGHRQFHNPKQPPVLIAGHPQPQQIILQCLIIGIVDVFFHCRHHRGWVDEPGNIVDVSISVVADNSFIQPTFVTPK
jgi:hypothetical protein